MHIWLACWDWIQTQSLVMQAKSSPGCKSWSQGPKATDVECLLLCKYSLLVFVANFVASFDLEENACHKLLSEEFLIQHLSLLVSTAAPVAQLRVWKRRWNHTILCVLSQSCCKQHKVHFIQMLCVGQQTLRLDEIKEWVMFFYWLNRCSININLRPDLCCSWAHWLVSQLWMPQSNSHWL